MRNLLRGWKPDLVCFRETKVGIVIRAFIRSLLGGGIMWSGVV